MTDKLTLPNGTIFQFYEGSDEDLFTDLTGQNLNRAANQLKQNIEELNSKLSDLIIGGDIYDPEITYSRFRLVKSDVDSRFLYMSVVNNNKGNPLNDTNYWIPVRLNIDDDSISLNTTWSSSKINQSIMETVIALG